MRNEKDPYVAPIMARFCCSEDMAYTIIRSAKKSGEYEKLKAQCDVRRNKNDGE